MAAALVLLRTLGELVFSGRVFRRRAMRRVPTDPGATVICPSPLATRHRPNGPTRAVAKDGSATRNGAHYDHHHNDDDDSTVHGCGRLTFAGDEVRAGRGLAAWRDWPFDLDTPSFEAARDALVDVFAARLDAWVARIEVAPLIVPARRTHDDAPLSLRHYRYSVVTAPAVAYTSTVWWMPSALTDAAVFGDQDDDDDDNDCKHNDDGHEIVNNGDTNGTSGMFVEEGVDRAHDDQSDALCRRPATDGTDMDAHVDASRKHPPDRQTTESTGCALDNGIDLATATSRLCRRNTVVPNAPALLWRGTVDDVVAQLDDIRDSALCVHAILSFRPADSCAGVCVFDPRKAHSEGVL